MGRTKGLLPAPGSSKAHSVSLVERLLRVCSQSVGSSVVLVGRLAEYEFLKLPSLSDAAPGAGPLAGLVALLEHAGQHGYTEVLALACDLPFVSESLLSRLARVSSTSLAVCPYAEGKYDPLFARYRVESQPLFREALERGQLSLQPVLRRISPQVLEVSEEERLQLRDWDFPSDMSEH